MFGLIGKIKAVPGQRDKLIAILIERKLDEIKTWQEVLETWE